jgi:cytidine deaminase
MAASPEELREIAARLAEAAYCPYSGFRVAALLEDSGGGLHPGVNVENGSYGLTICAERSAVFHAVAANARCFSRMLVHSPDGEPLPCGSCREVLAEFCVDDFPILVSGPRGIRSLTLGELLPHRFPREALPGRG